MLSFYVIFLRYPFCMCFWYHFLCYQFYLLTFLLSFLSFFSWELDDTSDDNGTKSFNDTVARISGQPLYTKAFIGNNLCYRFRRQRLCQLQRRARANFFWVRNRNSATWRKHFRDHNSAIYKEMLSATATPQFRNCNFFSEVCNFKSATWELYFRNFRHIFDRGVALNFIFFSHHVFFFCYWEDFKESVARDFWPLFFRESTPCDPLSHTMKDFLIRFQIAIPQI